MRVLVGCEFSARVRDAFRARGHDAVSCDIEPTTGDPRYHIQGDIRAVLGLGQGWDLMILFPPCTYLTKSNAWRWEAISEQRAEALDFVRLLLGASCARIALENPVGAIGTAIQPATQYVQPWQFGDPYQKTTGLWLKGLPPLRPEVTDKPEGVVPWCEAGYGPKREDGTRRVAGHARKASERNLTFPGIARAMSEQWG